MISMREENLRERKKRRRACVRRLRMLLVLFSIFLIAYMACGDSYAVELSQAGEAVISDAVSCKSLYAV